MRQGQNGKRSRGNRRNNNNASRTVDSNGPEVKIRGSASHIYEKYQALARDANVAGERIASENYLQHAEHYYRVMNLAAANNSQNNRQEGSGDGDPRRDARNRQNQKPPAENRTSESPATASESPATASESPATASESPATESAAAVEGAPETLPGLPPAAPQQPPRRRRTRTRRPAENRQTGEKSAEEGTVAEATEQSAASVAEPKSAEAVETPGASEEV